MKDPAARLVHIICTRSPSPAAIIPTTTPRGVAQAKMNNNQRTVPKSSGNVFTNDIPRELEAAPLWTTIAITMFKVPENSYPRPKASPSNIAWTDKAISRTKGVTLHEQQPFFFAGFSTFSN